MEAESSVDVVNAAIGIDALLGLWIAFSPFLLRFRDVVPAAWNNVGVGVVIAILSGFRISVGYSQSAWSWLTAVLSLWLIASPFALHFEHNPTAMWNNICLGVVVALVSWRAAWHDHSPTSDAGTASSHT